ncbi:hypothetical protein GALL_479730 [mine drainage metagenome]|uniref:Uncharacterized protein n=1 Tax=mine drainage metagenome TaxID=410659 RepID=A0A1J5Q3G5_9ZZZZ
MHPDRAAKHLAQCYALFQREIAERRFFREVDEKTIVIEQLMQGVVEGAAQVIRGRHVECAANLDNELKEESPTSVLVRQGRSLA